MTEKVRPVRGHLDVQTKVADRKRIEQRRTGGHICVELQDSLTVGAQLQLARGTEHAVRLNPADLAALDLEAARKHGSHRGVGILLAGLHVGSPTHHFHDLGAVVDVTQRESIGVGMLLDPLHLGDDDAGKVLMYRLNRLDRRAEHREFVSHVVGIELDIQECRQPID